MFDCSRLLNKFILRCIISNCSVMEVNQINVLTETHTAQIIVTILQQHYNIFTIWPECYKCCCNIATMICAIWGGLRIVKGIHLCNLVSPMLSLTLKMVHSAFSLFYHLAFSPIDTCLDVPKRKYMKTGKKAIYMPTTGGRFPRSAYAIPCGICIIATVRPEIMSGNISSLQLYRLSHCITGIVDTIQDCQFFDLTLFITLRITANRRVYNLCL